MYSFCTELVIGLIDQSNKLSYIVYNSHVHHLDTKGGMFFGFLCGLSTMKRLSKAFFGVKTNLLSQLQTFLVRFFGIIFTVICVIIASIVLVSLQNGTIIKCPGCRYVSCVPFPFWETENKWW